MSRFTTKLIIGPDTIDNIISMDITIRKWGIETKRVLSEIQKENKP